MITDHATRTESDRKITWHWDGPAIEDEKDPGWHKRIQLIISHDKDYKRYSARLYSVDVRFERGYTMTRFGVFTSASASVMSKPASRFSHNALVLFESEVLAECELAVERDSYSAVTGLLREALGYSALAI